MNRKEKFVQSWKRGSPIFIIIGLTLVLFPLLVGVILWNDPAVTLKKIYKPLGTLEYIISQDKEAFKAMKPQIQTEKEKYLWGKAMQYADLTLRSSYSSSLGNLKSLGALFQVSGMLFMVLGIVTRKFIKNFE